MRPALLDSFNDGVHQAWDSEFLGGDIDGKPVFAKGL